METKSELFWRAIGKLGVRIRNICLFILFFQFYLCFFLFFLLYFASIHSTVTQQFFWLPSFVHNSCLVLTIVPSVVLGFLQVCFFFWSMLFSLCVCCVCEWVSGWVKGRGLGLGLDIGIFVVHYYIYVTLGNDVYS